MHVVAESPGAPSLSSFCLLIIITNMQRHVTLVQGMEATEGVRIIIVRMSNLFFRNDE